MNIQFKSVRNPLLHFDQIIFIKFVRTVLIHTSSLRDTCPLLTEQNRYTDAIVTSSVFLNHERLTNCSAQLTQAHTFEITFEVLVYSLYLSEILSVRYRSIENLKISPSLLELLSHVLCLRCNGFVSTEV